jgi:BASS family bile acid:Na+ symporter
VILQNLLPLGLAFIMFTLGLGLCVSDFTRLVRDPRPMLLGLLSQIVLLPMIGLALIVGYNGEPEFAFGLMILAASPGGITSNYLTMLAGGNMALSVSLTAITSLASIVTVPMILGSSQYFLLDAQQEIIMPVGRIMSGIFLIVGVPVFTGMLLQYFYPSRAIRVRRHARQLAALVFVTIVVGAFYGEMDSIMTNFWEIGPRLILLNLSVMSIAFGIASSLNLERPEGIAITLECGLQNAALAIYIALTLLENTKMMVPAIIYALLMNISAALFIFWVRRSAGSLAERQQA